MSYYAHLKEDEAYTFSEDMHSDEPSFYKSEEECKKAVDKFNDYHNIKMDWDEVEISEIAVTDEDIENVFKEACKIIDEKLAQGYKLLPFEE